MTGEGTHKPGLLEAAAALREVHRALVQAVRKTYEREVGPAGGPGQMLRLLTEDPYFAWLHPMSELIVDLDSLLTQELLPPGTVAGVRQEIDRLTRAGGDEGGSGGDAGEKARGRRSSMSPAGSRAGNSGRRPCRPVAPCADINC